MRGERGVERARVRVALGVRGEARAWPGLWSLKAEEPPQVRSPRLRLAASPLVRPGWLARLSAALAAARLHLVCVPSQAGGARDHREVRRDGEGTGGGGGERERGGG